MFELVSGGAGGGRRSSDAASPSPTAASPAALNSLTHCPTPCELPCCPPAPLDGSAAAPPRPPTNRPTTMARTATPRATRTPRWRSARRWAQALAQGASARPCSLSCASQRAAARRRDPPAPPKPGSPLQLVCRHTHACTHTPHLLPLSLLPTRPQDVYKTGDQIKAAGGTVTREPGPVPGIGTKILACTDPGGFARMGVGARGVQCATWGEGGARPQPQASRCLLISPCRLPGGTHHPATSWPPEPPRLPASQLHGVQTATRSCLWTTRTSLKSWSRSERGQREWVRAGAKSVYAYKVPIVS